MPRSPRTAPDPRAVAADLRIAVFRLARRLRQQPVGDLSPAVGTALATIAREGPITLGALARQEQLSPPAITKITERLLAEGLVERTVDPDDRRVSRVAITPRGRAQLESTRERRTEWLVDRFALLTPAELDTVADAARILQRLSEPDGPTTGGAP